MKLLVLEYITGGGMRRETLPASLASEGELMLSALISDLRALSLDLELTIFRDNRLPLPFQGDGIQIVMVTDADSFQALWMEWVGRCNFMWPIAPETGGILEQLCLDVEAAGKNLLTCPSSAVRLAASKLKTARRLAESGLPVVPTEILDRTSLPAWPASVVKPDDGAGCEGTLIIRDPVQFQTLADREGWIVQPLLEGEAISLCVLFANGGARLLSCNLQQIERIGGGFALKGVTVNAMPDQDGSLQFLAESVARAMPELWGYAGIDLVLTGDGPVILEINPRLTTSYAGLCLAKGENPAAWVLQLLTTGELPTLPDHKGKPIDIRWGNSHGN